MYTIFPKGLIVIEMFIQLAKIPTETLSPTMFFHFLNSLDVFFTFARNFVIIACIQPLSPLQLFKYERGGIWENMKIVSTTKAKDERELK
jgi:hypothetical protein